MRETLVLILIAFGSTFSGSGWAAGDFCRVETFDAITGVLDSRLRVAERLSKSGKDHEQRLREIYHEASKNAGMAEVVLGIAAAPGLFVPGQVIGRGLAKAKVGSPFLSPESPVNPSSFVAFRILDEKADAFKATALINSDLGIFDYAREAIHEREPPNGSWWKLRRHEEYAEFALTNAIQLRQTYEAEERYIRELLVRLVKACPETAVHAKFQAVLRALFGKKARAELSSTAKSKPVNRSPAFEKTREEAPAADSAR